MTVRLAATGADSRDDADLPVRWQAILCGIALVGCLTVVPQVFVGVGPGQRLGQAACWLGLACLVPLWTAARRGRAVILPPSLLGVLWLAVVAITALGLRLMDPGLRFSEKAWPWTCAGAVLISWSVCRHVALAAGAVVVAALVLSAAAAGPGADAGAADVALVVGELLLGPWAGLALITMSRDEVRRRRAVAAGQAVALREARAAEVGRRDEQERLSLLRERALPLLDEVAAGGELPLGAADRERARALAEELRERLSTTSRLAWLLRAHAGDGSRPRVSVRLVDAGGRADRLGLAAQGDLAAVVALLATSGRCASVVVSVTGDGDRLHVLLVARGPGVGSLRHDEALAAASAALDARVLVEDAATLTIEFERPAEELA